MEITETLHVINREDWRTWLQAHYKSKSEIWLIYNKKQSGKPRIPYNDAVEESLCFGWIDSTVKTLDENQYVQRFSPRRSKSKYSQTNKERLKRLIEQGKVIPEVLEGLADIDLDEFEYPADILAALQANEQAWENFQTYSEAYQRIRVAYVDTARDRPEEFEKRLKRLIEKTEKGKQFGFGIGEYY